MKPLREPSERGSIWPAGVALGAVCAIKVAAALQLGRHPLLQPNAGLDTTAYVGLAGRVIHGDLGLGPGLYYVSPLYIYFLALVEGVTRSWTAVRIVQGLLGAAAVACVYSMAKAWGGRRAAWIAAGSAALCGVMTFYEIVLLQSALDGILTSLALTALAWALTSDPPVRRSAVKGERSTRTGGAWFFITGVALGLQTLNRPNVLLPAVVLAVLLCVLRRVRPALLVVAGLSLGVGPVAVRNVVVAHQWSLVSSHGGLNFFIGNSARATGFYEPVPGIRPDIDGQREDTRRVAEAATGRRLDDSQVSDYFFDLGTEWVRTHPGAAIGLFARKLFYVFHADDTALPHSYGFFAYDAKTMLRWLPANPWLIVPLGVAGLLWCVPRERKAEFLVWAAFVPAYAVSIAVFFVAERYRLPMFVPMFVGVGLLIDRLTTMGLGAAWGSARGRWLGAAVTVGALALLVNWPIALNDSREGDRLRMVLYAAEHGRIEEATGWAARARQVSTSPAHIDATLGHALLVAGRPAEAIGVLTRAQSGGLADARTMVDLASAESRTGDRVAAVSTLRAIALPALSDPDEPLLTDAGRLAGQLGATDLAVSFFREATRIRPEDADAWAQLGFALLAADGTNEAVRALEEAVRRHPGDAVALGGLAVAELRLGRAQDAARHARAALALDPDEQLSQQVLAAARSGGSWDDP